MSVTKINTITSGPHMQQLSPSVDQTTSATPAFGPWLRRLRKASDLTQDDLAEQIGYAGATIRKIEAGLRRPSHEIAERLAQLLIANPDQRSAFVRAARTTPTSDETSRPADQPHTQALPSVPAHPAVCASLPTSPTPLIGRADELAKLMRLLSDPACRLITLAGPGGAGKTRLALQAAKQAAARFAHGAAFVALAPCATTEALVPASAEALGFALCRPTDAQAQLLDYMREKELLLVLDNLEHLIDGAAELLAAISRQARGVKLLVTSRERLRVQGEWVAEVGGLPTPPSDSAGAIERSSAVALFLRQAHQARPGFQPTPDDLRAIAQICRLVEGLPLAIEMAAAWTRMLSCAEIVQEIERSLDFLVASARDIPARHRSLRAVFDHSWRLLSEAEHQALRRLAVFRGGFTRQAAEAVAAEWRNSLPAEHVHDSSCSILHILVALVDKSLLRRVGPARYEMHELVRQYAAARLADDPGEHDAAHAHHSAYFAGWLRECASGLKGAHQQATLAAIGAELDNLRLAWDRAIERRDLDRLGDLIGGIARFYELRSRFQEGQAIFQRALSALRAGAPDAGGASTRQQADQVILGKLLAKQGWFAGRMGQLSQAAALLRECLELTSKHDQPTAQSAILGLGIVTYRQGAYAAAQLLFDESLAIARATDDRWSIALNLSHQGLLARARGEYHNARSLLQASIALGRAEGEWRGATMGLSYLGAVHIALGERAKAQALLREGLAVSGAYGDRWAMAMTLYHLGLAAQAEHAADEAQYLLVESLASFRQIGDYWSLGHALVALGGLAHERGARQEAKDYLSDALKLAATTQTHPIALKALAGLADVLAAAGAAEQALELLAHVELHPATWAQVRTHATRRAAELAAKMASERAAAARRRGEAQTLETIVEALLSRPILALNPAHETS
jgi:predicted ATPase/transcriptional regulator with XRE-family HTH domain